MTKVTFEFPDEPTAKEFVRWLGCHGEQNYWEWTAERQLDFETPAAVRFEYPQNLSESDSSRKEIVTPTLPK